MLIIRNLNLISVQSWTYRLFFVLLSISLALGNGKKSDPGNKVQCLLPFHTYHLQSHQMSDQVDVVFA